MNPIVIQFLPPIAGKKVTRTRKKFKENPRFISSRRATVNPKIKTMRHKSESNILNPIIDIHTPDDPFTKIEEGIWF